MTSLQRTTPHIATITLLGSNNQDRHPWGTLVYEHRWNPLVVQSLKQHLLAVKRDRSIHCVVLTGQGKFWSNGLDLAWLDAHTEKEGNDFTRLLNSVMALLLTFPIPTIAALNGHWCAAGGMLGLTLDYRVMNQDKGYFFVPAVDLGVVYNAFQIELMKSKMPWWMVREVVVFNATRWQALELQTAKVIDVAVPSSKVLSESMALAKKLIVTKGHGPSRIAMGPIKRKVYAQVLDALRKDENGLMGFKGRTTGNNYAPPPVISKL